MGLLKDLEDFEARLLAMKYIDEWKKLMQLAKEERFAAMSEVVRLPENLGFIAPPKDDPLDIQRSVNFMVQSADLISRNAMKDIMFLDYPVGAVFGKLEDNLSPSERFKSVFPATSTEPSIYWNENPLINGWLFPDCIRVPILHKEKKKDWLNDDWSPKIPEKRKSLTAKQAKRRLDKKRRAKKSRKNSR